MGEHNKASWVLIFVLLISVTAIILLSVGGDDGFLVSRRIESTEFEYLEVVDNYTRRVSNGKTHSNRWYLVIDANGERRDVSVPEKVFKQVIKGDKINCQLSKDKDGKLLKLDIVVGN